MLARQEEVFAACPLQWSKHIWNVEFTPGTHVLEGYVDKLRHIERYIAMVKKKKPKQLGYFLHRNLS